MHCCASLQTYLTLTFDSVRFVICVHEVYQPVEISRFLKSVVCPLRANEHELTRIIWDVYFRVLTDDSIVPSTIRNLRLKDATDYSKTLPTDT